MELSSITNKITEQADYAGRRVKRIYDMGRYYGVGAVMGKVKRKLARTFTHVDPENLPEQTYRVWKKNALKDVKPNPMTRLTFGVILTDLTGQENRSDIERLPMVRALRAQTLRTYKFCKPGSVDKAGVDYVILARGCDIVEPRFIAALTEYITAREDWPEAVYTDEDIYHVENGLRIYEEPFMKPDYSPDYFNGYNYIRRMTVVKTELYCAVSAEMDCEPAETSTEFIFRVCEKARQVGHLALPFYSMRDGEYYVETQSAEAVQRHLDRTGVLAVASDTDQGFVDVQYPLVQEPFVSVVIPSKDHKADLERTLESLFKSNYENCEYVIVENNSTEPETFAYYKELEAREDVNVRVVKWRGKGFNFSALNNFGAREANGEYLLLMNNDMEVINPDFLREMLRVAQRDSTGIVGARLYYEDGTLQHAGVFVGYCGVADGSFRGLPETEERLRWTGVTREVSVVTAACLLIRRSAYLAIGGMDETFAVNFNDVDFCLRVRSRKQKVMYVPSATLYHYESKSRGADESKADKTRVYKEIENFTRKWHKFIQQGDPYYNPNLTKNKVDYSLKEWRFDEV